MKPYPLDSICVFSNPLFPHVYLRKVKIVEDYEVEGRQWYNVELHDKSIMAVQEEELKLLN